jgi:apolipoprotein D and lipocalin family protein
MIVFVPTAATNAAVRVSMVEPSGKTRSFRGTAEWSLGSDGGRFRVKFHGLTQIVPASDQDNYWVIGLDARYQTTMGATPDRQYLWIPSREPHLPLGAAKAYLILVAKEGFQMKDLIWDYSQTPPR